jgi:hypothetical protein
MAVKSAALEGSLLRNLSPSPGCWYVNSAQQIVRDLSEVYMETPAEMQSSGMEGFSGDALATVAPLVWLKASVQARLDGC